MCYCLLGEAILFGAFVDSSSTITCWEPKPSFVMTTEENIEQKKTDLHLLITALMDDNGPWLEKEREKMYYTFISPEEGCFFIMPSHWGGA